MIISMIIVLLLILLMVFTIMLIITLSCAIQLACDIEQVADGVGHLDFGRGPTFNLFRSWWWPMMMMVMMTMMVMMVMMLIMCQVPGLWTGPNIHRYHNNCHDNDHDDHWSWSCPSRSLILIMTMMIISKVNPNKYWWEGDGLLGRIQGQGWAIWKALGNKFAPFRPWFRPKRCFCDFELAELDDISRCQVESAKCLIESWYQWIHGWWTGGHLKQICSLPVRWFQPKRFARFLRINRYDEYDNDYNDGGNDDDDD